ncbi:hypothetical protein [Effusibacillus pohliae]|uniref:hypothetical protein n=1 Tax=Effusibacillus pohliae TaxID=232270 RepID=UPI000371D9D4|nr:hypothetical protein [Effusibacillus pohliae]
MSSDDAMALERCRHSLKRIAWRIQYRVRSQKNRELLQAAESLWATGSFDQAVIEKLHVEQLIHQIREPKGRYVVCRVILDGMTEREVAQELNVCQQAVNKWKKKGRCKC